MSSKFDQYQKNLNIIARETDGTGHSDQWCRMADEIASTFDLNLEDSSDLEKLLGCMNELGAIHYKHSGDFL